MSQQQQQPQPLSVSEREELVRLRAEIALLRSQQEQHTPPPPPPPSSSSFLSAAAGLDKEQVERYSRQALLPECGPEGTAAFLAAKVAVIGCGGLGSTAILFLAASGVGHLVLVDADVVDRSNLHRQVIHPDGSVGVAKVLSAQRSALALNPTIRIDTHNARFSPAIADAVLEGCTVVLDCTDNVAARYLINDACVRRGLPLVSGAAMRWDGQLSVYNVPLGASPAPTIVAPKNAAGAAAAAVYAVADDEFRHHRAPTYRCMHPQPPPQAATGGGCNDIGVFGPVPGIVGCMQALEALKTIIFLDKLRRSQSAGTAAPTSDHLLAGRMLVWDAHGATFRTIKMRPRCAAGVNASVQGELTALGGAYDGCGMVKISEDGVCNVQHVRPAEIRQMLRLRATTTSHADASGRRQRDDGASAVLPPPQQALFEQCRSLLLRGERPPLQKLTLIVDVRSDIQFRMCNLADLYDLPAHRDGDNGGHNVLLYVSQPYLRMETQLNAVLQAATGDAAAATLSTYLRQELFAVLGAGGELPVPTAALSLQLLCRRGRDSLRATVLLEKIKQHLIPSLPVAAQADAAVALLQAATVQNVAGGLNAWSESADSAFPYY